ncbi:MAG: transposase, partial [bacterium]
MAKQNKYLLEHPKAKMEVSKRKIEKFAKKLGLNKWVSIITEDRSSLIKVDEEALKEISKLDGCYVIKT